MTGCTFYVKHLDGRVIEIKTPENQVIRPGSTFAVENEGMPVYKSAFNKGNLYITFEVDFPIGRVFSSAEKSKLLDLFPYNPEKKPSDAKSVEENIAQEVNPEELQARARAYDSPSHDHEEEHDGRGVQCKQQ